MRPHDGSPTKRALPMLLGFALTGWIGSAPAHAQNNNSQNNMPPSSMQNSTGNDADINNEMYSMDDFRNPDAFYMIPDPAPMNYLFAPPGGLNLEHWTDYRQMNTAPGPPQDVRYRKRRALERMRRETGREGMLYYDQYASNNPSGYNDQTGYMGNSQPMYYRRSDTYQSAYGYGGMMAMQPAIAASGDFVYVLQGSTLYQLRLADMSVVTQRDLPWPGSGAGTSAYNGSGTYGSTGNYSGASVQNGTQNNTGTDTNSQSGTNNSNTQTSPNPGTGTDTNQNNNQSTGTQNNPTGTNGNNQNNTNPGTQNNGAGTNGNANLNNGTGTNGNSSAGI